MKLGKKLEVTDIKERMKLLIDGEVFYTFEGNSVYFDVDFFVFLCDDNAWNKLDQELVSSDWYYPVKTYTINGVELVDERVNNTQRCLNKKQCYVPAFYQEDIDESFFSIAWLERTAIVAADRGLLFATKEAAIAHAKAMIQVQESSK